ncbi:hypothetical protein [Methylophilus sp.]|uniref:hypothetical protein n=1 Tax=Methylophilus sp. TaxID=29541 RepID=UPI000D4F3465|nr:hypothetical protein [Methylophilus sp.]PPD12170.1 MAG: hypothetical protein CTY26_06150 [Methylophilus sp.]
MSGLIIGVPVTIADANIEAFSVPENEYPQWDPGETYDLGEYVIVTGTDIHQIWRSVANSNTGNNPLDEVDLDNPSKWALDGATNAYKMFDQYISTLTQQAGSISFTLKGLGQVNTFGFFGLKGDTLTMTIRDEDGTFISTETRELVSYATFNSEYDWFFTPFLSIDFMVFKDIPPYFNARYEITVTGAQCAIGAVVPAYGYEFNSINRNSTNTPKDYSIKTEKTPGVFEFVKGPSALESELELTFPNQQIDLLNRLVKQQFSLPTLVIGNDEYESFTHYGNVYECPNSLPYANEGSTRLKVESLF